MSAVSVIIPTRGRERHETLLTRAIPSAIWQSYSGVECVVVSGDPDPELAERMKNELLVPTRQHMPIHLECPEDHSFRDVGSQARNYGVKHANGEYIAYLDDDSAFHPDHIEKLVGMLEANPTCDFVYSRFVFHWGDGRTQLGGAAPPVFGRIDCSSIVHRRDFLEKFGEWPVPNTYPDAEAANRWLSNGATWMFYGQPTFDYHYETPGLLYPGRERAAGVPGPA